MNKKIKISFVKQIAKQKGTVAMLCIVCTMFFMASGCGKLDNVSGYNVEEAPENKDNSYYFYNHEREKVFISLNTKYAFLSVVEPQMPVEIALRGIEASEFKADNSDKKQYRGKQGTCRFYAELSFEKDLTDKQYLELLSDIKRQNSSVIIAPYFKLKADDKVGLSNFFYVKLKDEKDVALLEKMAEQTGSIIIEQDAFMPLWFTLSVTEVSELNALEYANVFHESGLFEAGEADLMPDSLIESWL